MLPVGKFNNTSVLIGRDRPPRGALELIEIDTTIEFEEAQYILDNERIKDALRINCLWFELIGPFCKSASRSYGLLEPPNCRAFPFFMCVNWMTPLPLRN